MTTRGLALAVVLSLGLLYASHVRGATFVYEDGKIVDSADRPFDRARLIQGRGLTQESWTLIRTPQAAHALNLALHLLVCVLTALLLWQMTGQAWLSVAVASLVALHPVGTETVAYAASRAELIAAVGVLVALVCLTSQWAWTWALVPWALALAYLGKETGLVGIGLLPLVLWFKGDRQWAARIAFGLVGTGIAAFVVLSHLLPHLVHLGESSTAQVGAPEWALTQALATYRLLVLSLVPLWLSVTPWVGTVTWWTGGAALILLLGCLEAAWHLRERHPLMTFGIVWCALVAVPRFIARTPGSPFNEHQWYLALVGVACVLVGLITIASVRLERWAVRVA